LLSILYQAGWPIWPLVATSVVALALIIERLLSLRAARIVPRSLLVKVDEMVTSGQDTPEAINRLERHSPLGFVLAEVLRSRGLPVDQARLAIEDAGRAVAYQLGRYIPALGTIAVISPLMGLFGTVVGMIQIFGAYSQTAGDPVQLAHGISVALYNTGFGILIAIPAMIFHRYFRARVEHFLFELEQAAGRRARAFSLDPQ
jgi:biopolymer transport protein ExbB